MKTPPLFIIFVLLLPWCLFAGSAFADRILKTDGRVIDGFIESREPDGHGGENLLVRIGAGKIHLSSSEIEKIVASSPAENDLLKARDFLKSGEASRAVEALNGAIDKGITPDELAGAVLALGDDLAKGVAAMGPEARRKLSRALAAVAEARAPHYDDLIAMRLRLHLMLGERDKANALFAALGAEYFAQHPAIRKNLAQWLLDSLTEQFKVEDYARVMELLEDLRRVDPTIAEGRETQFYLQWARLDRRNGRYENALDLYATKVFPDAPQIARDRIAVTLQEAEETCGLQNQLDRAARLYEQYGLPFVPEATKKRLVQLRRNEGWRYVREDNLTSATAAFAKAEAVDAGSARKDLDFCEFRRRATDLKTEDPLAHYQLALWCKEHALFDEALSEFAKTESNPEIAKNAQEHVRQIQNQEAEKELGRLMGLYEQGEYIDAMNGVYDFLQKGYALSFEDQARDIESLAREAVRLQQIERPQQADALLQQAYRAYWQDRYSEAYQRLKVLMDHYRDTLAYPRARSLYALVREKLALSDLEEGRLPEVEDSPTTSILPFQGAEKPARMELEQLIKSLRSERNP